MPLDDTTFPALPMSSVSERITSTTHIQHDLRLPMRDGVDLSLDLIRPDVPGAYPVILARTPYDKTKNRTPALHELAWPPGL